MDQERRRLIDEGLEYSAKLDYIGAVKKLEQAMDITVELEEKKALEGIIGKLCYMQFKKTDGNSGGSWFSNWSQYFSGGLAYKPPEEQYNPGCVNKEAPSAKNPVSGMDFPRDGSSSQSLLNQPVETKAPEVSGGYTTWIIGSIVAILAAFLLYQFGYMM